MVNPVSVEVSDLARSGRFYDALLGPLGWRAGRHRRADRLGHGQARVFFLAAGPPPPRHGWGHVMLSSRDPGGWGGVGGVRRGGRRRGAGTPPVRLAYCSHISRRPRAGYRVEVAVSRIEGEHTDRARQSGGRDQRVRPDRAQPLPRGPRARGRPRVRGRQRHHRRRDPGAPAQVRLDPRAASRARSRPDDAIVVDGSELKVLAERIPRSSRGAISGWRSWSSRPASSVDREAAAKHLEPARRR